MTQDLFALEELTVQYIENYGYGRLIFDNVSD